jgi:hypothetical protein
MCGVLIDWLFSVLIVYESILQAPSMSAPPPPPRPMGMLPSQHFFIDMAFLVDYLFATQVSRRRRRRSRDLLIERRRVRRYTF